MRLCLPPGHDLPSFTHKEPRRNFPMRPTPVITTGQGLRGCIKASVKAVVPVSTIINTTKLRYSFNCTIPFRAAQYYKGCILVTYVKARSPGGAKCYRKTSA